MHRRTFLLGTAGTTLAAALPAAAEPLSLGEISRYLNSIDTATSEFTQVNPDGTISTGQVFIRRPGRVRFEYNPPEEALVIAGGGQVAVFDGKSNQPPEQFPLRQTPLSIILADNVDLTRADMVTGHTSDGTTTTVTAQDPERPEYGSIRLVFTANPVELRQWVVTDGSGSETTVILGALRTGVSVGSRAFNIPLELRDRGL